MPACPACGHENMPGMIFCTACGHGLSTEQPSEDTTTSLATTETAEAHDDVAESSASASIEQDDNGATQADLADSFSEAQDEPIHPSLVVEDGAPSPTIGQMDDIPMTHAQPSEDVNGSTTHDVDQSPETDATASSEPILEAQETADGVRASPATQNSPDDGQEHEVHRREGHAAVRLNEDGEVLVKPEPSGESGVNKPNSVLGFLPEPPAGPVSPLQFDDGGEAVFGRRWWLRPESIIPEERPDRTDEYDAPVEGMSTPNAPTTDQSMHAVNVPTKQVIELDRRRFDQLPTLEESESSRSWMVVAVIALVLVAAAAALI
ncbi:MAG: zinc ribbon domain-containing protein [Myxococcota bacterium]|nr:zinc ribbon domain-containing protein [Myxococcota bacterium]